MKTLKSLRIIASLCIMHCALCINLSAQTLNVKVGNVTYLFPASQTGDMTFGNENATTLTIMGKTFTLSDIDAMTVDDSEVEDNMVNVIFDGTTANIMIAGNVAQYVEATANDAHVSISQTNTAAVDDDEITYALSGTSTDGSFTLAGSYKCTVSLAGITLTNPSGAAINITNSKRIQLSAKKNTVNTLTDGSGSQKACIYSKGQLQIQGNGTLNVVGNYKHGIKSASYISIKNLTLNITKAVSDGISCEEYFQMKSGTVTISGVGDDGIQCDLGGDTSTGETTDHDDEDSGNVYLEGGTLNITVTAAAAKGIKADGDLVISGGSTLVVSGASKPTLKSGVTISSGTKIFDGVGCPGAVVSGGSNVTLSSYSGGGGGGFPGRW